MDAILPKYNSQLKRDCSQRKSQYVKKQDTLDPIVEINIYEVFLAEINGFRVRERMLQVLINSKPNFNWKDLFALIDKGRGAFDIAE